MESFILNRAIDHRQLQKFLDAGSNPGPRGGCEGVFAPFPTRGYIACGFPKD